MLRHTLTHTHTHTNVRTTALASLCEHVNLNVNLNVKLCAVAGNKCKGLTGDAGICKRLDACPWALGEVRKGRRPKVCRFAGPHPIVCCPGIAAAPPAGTAPASHVNPLASGSAASRDYGRIARQKCLEYAAYVFAEEDSVVLMPTRDRVDQCAASADALIVGGTEAKAMEFPHMALIGYGEANEIDWWCGGSLISPDFVLTAGHCLLSGTRPARWVMLGELDRSTEDDDAQPQTIEVAEIIKHPDYSPPVTYNDIALLRLKKRAEMSGYVRPACLHTQPTIGTANRKGGSSDEEVPVATGWGHTEFQGDLSDHLMKVALREADHASCARAYSNTPKLKLPRGIQAGTQLCAGGQKDKDTCQGDSGGPLQLATRNRTGAATEPYCMYKVVGVTSFGQACGFAPGVYTRVYHYVPWIEKIVWPSG